MYIDKSGYKHIEIGDRFGKLTVIDKADPYIDPQNRHRSKYICKCDCGNIINIRSDKLVLFNETLSCGHCTDIHIGDRFGKLTVIDKANDYISPSIYYKAKWKCLCDCGNYTIVVNSDLKTGHTKTCGHCTDIHIGDRFGKLTVIDKADDYISPSTGYHNTRWKCLCDCGNYVIVRSSCLKNGDTKSCGCLFKEKVTKHNLSNARIYYEYTNMKKRCYNINDPGYNDYGARGIIICDEWLDKDNGFMNFYTWAINNGYREDLTIDRINVNGNYEPSNCRWIPKEYQAHNKRYNKFICFNGEKYTLMQISNILGVSYDLLHFRLKSNNWDFSSLFTYLPDQYGNMFPYILDRYGKPIFINAIYFIDEYGFPISQDKIKE